MGDNIEVINPLNRIGFSVVMNGNGLKKWSGGRVSAVTEFPSFHVVCVCGTSYGYLACPRGHTPSPNNHHYAVSREHNLRPARVYGNPFLSLQFRLFFMAATRWNNMKSSARQRIMAPRKVANYGKTACAHLCNDPGVNELENIGTPVDRR